VDDVEHVMTNGCKQAKETTHESRKPIVPNFASGGSGALPELTLLRNLLRGQWNASGFMARELWVFKADLVFSSPRAAIQKTCLTPPIASDGLERSH
jgi:hypothetical protein